MRLHATKSKKKGLFVSSNPTLCFAFPIRIKTLDCKFFSAALLNTIASTCFMDKDFAMNHSLNLIGKAYPALMEIIDGRPLASGNVMEETQPLEVMLGDIVSPTVINIIQCLANTVVLGLPWIELHNPNVDWNLQMIFLKHKNKNKNKNPTS